MMTLTALLSTAVRVSRPVRLGAIRLCASSSGALEPSSVVAADVDESSGEPLEPSSPQAVTMSAQGTRVRARRQLGGVGRGRGIDTQTDKWMAR